MNPQTLSCDKKLKMPIVQKLKKGFMGLVPKNERKQFSKDFDEGFIKSCKNKKQMPISGNNKTLKKTQIKKRRRTGRKWKK